MRSALLDINVLLALLDSDHVDHSRAQTWVAKEMESAWASCAITENGFVRIISQPRYPSPIPPASALTLLTAARRDSGDHEFWPCEVSVLDDAVIDRTRLHNSRQVTDAYLLALAVVADGRFVTFDRGIALSTVRGASAHHLHLL